LSKKEIINVQRTGIILYEGNKDDFIAITDIARYQDSARSNSILQNKMRNRSSSNLSDFSKRLRTWGWASFLYNGDSKRMA
jgi:hypothetical protein